MRAARRQGVMMCGKDTHVLLNEYLFRSAGKIRLEVMHLINTAECPQQKRNTFKKEQKTIKKVRK